MCNLCSSQFKKYIFQILIYHCFHFSEGRVSALLNKESLLLLHWQVLAEEEQTLVFTIPIFEPLPSQYYVRGVSDRWLGSEVVCALSFKHLILPEKHPPHTELLDLQPLPITALKCKEYELLYG